MPVIKSRPTKISVLNVDGSGQAPGSFTVQLTANQTSLWPAGSTSLIASGAQGMIADSSPDLPPGRTLGISTTGQVLIKATADAPPVDIKRPWVIEVKDSPIATIFNRTKGKTYGKTYNGTNWYQCMEEANDGDLIEISPGAINQTVADCQNYFYFLDNTAMTISKGVTIRNIPGRGRWSLFAAGVTIPSSLSGITIFSPTALEGRKSFTIEGFNIVDQFGIDRDAYGVRIRGDASSGANFNNMHTAATFRNFKVGKTSTTAGSGFNNGAETLTLEDGHIFDCGWSGYEHNLYISARTLIMKGVRCSRTRGGLDGHLLKGSAVNATIEGCVFESDPKLGDCTHHIQAKAGGNFVVRGCLFIDSLANNSAGRGPINMCRELAEDSSPNFEPWAGLAGNSLLVEKCVFVGHYGRAAVYFFPVGHTYNTGLTMASVVIRDNIGMIADTPSVIPDFPGLAGADYNNRKLWILNDPVNSQSWVERGNSVMPFGQDEPGFNEKLLLRYLRTAGPITVPRVISTLRFVYPHGFVARSDGFAGLG